MPVSFEISDECASGSRNTFNDAPHKNVRNVTRLVSLYSCAVPITSLSVVVPFIHREPAGQIASREMEIVRIKGALQRAEELSGDVADAIERAL